MANEKKPPVKRTVVPANKAKAKAAAEKTATGSNDEHVVEKTPRQRGYRQASPCGAVLAYRHRL